MSEHTCVICGEVVSKRKSLAWEDGRACRDHDEILKSQQKAAEKIQEKRDANMARNEIHKLIINITADGLLVDCYNNGWTKAEGFRLFKKQANHYADINTDQIIEVLRVFMTKDLPKSDEEWEVLRKYVYKINKILSSATP